MNYLTMNYEIGSTAFWVGLIACVLAFFFLGRFEGRASLLWAALSALVWSITPAVFWYKAAGQLGLCIVIAAVSILSERAREERRIRAALEGEPPAKPTPPRKSWRQR